MTTPKPTPDTSRLEAVINELLLNLEAHFAVPSITAAEAHQTAKANLLALVAEREKIARIDELQHFEPLQQDHSHCLDPRSCIGYQNAVSDFDNQKQIRLADLQSPAPPAGGQA